MSELLIELFSEEIPARMQLKAIADFERLMIAELKEQGLVASGSVQGFVTPRRLTLVMTGLPSKTPDTTEIRRGPREGAPDAALQGFMRGAGVARDDVSIEDIKGSRFYVASLKKPGKKAADVIAEALIKVIQSFPWLKSQRWGSGNLRWVRPLKSILCILDGAVVDLALEDIHSSDITYGHRFMVPSAIKVKDFADYRRHLTDAFVILDPARRADLIADSAQTLASAAGLDFDIDTPLLKEVAGLVEWPVPMMGSFDPAFLDVPEDVLILTMKKDQKYFILRDKASGKLAPKFIFTANIEPKDGGLLVQKGNERVLSARLSDARFFYEQDLKITSPQRIETLKNIIFHQKLGTVHDRSDRMADLSSLLAVYTSSKSRVRRDHPDLRPEVLAYNKLTVKSLLKNKSSSKSWLKWDLRDGNPPPLSLKAALAAWLSKSDLVSLMVYEFPEVQGVMGRYYALAEGVDKDIAFAISDHYAPLGPSDICPKEPVSIAVALAEKIDTLVGFFAIGQLPTGSKDPYALRRAALGVIRLITENGLRLPLNAVLQDHLKIYANFFEEAQIEMDQNGFEALLPFLKDRLKVAMKDKGVRHDLIDAVFATAGDDFVDILNRVGHLQTFIETEDGQNLLAGYKRAANIIKAEEKKNNLEKGGVVQENLFYMPEEQALFAALGKASARSVPLMLDENYEAVMTELACLRDPIDHFFDRVTVNDERAALRENRLALLQSFIAAVDTIAVFSRIEA